MVKPEKAGSRAVVEAHFRPVPTDDRAVSPAEVFVLEDNGRVMKAHQHRGSQTPSGENLMCSASTTWLLGAS